MYHVEQFKVGRFVAVVAGLGRNRGTWDSSHSRSAAYRHARRLNRERDGYTYRVVNEVWAI
jgi:hypothetical protein